MRISDWSSDVCSSDLPGPDDLVVHVGAPPPNVRCSFRAARLTRSLPRLQGAPNPICLSSAEGNIWAPVIWATSIMTVPLSSPMKPCRNWVDGADDASNGIVIQSLNHTGMQIDRIVKTTAKQIAHPTADHLCFFPGKPLPTLLKGKLSG